MWFNSLLQSLRPGAERSRENRVARRKAHRGRASQRQRFVPRLEVLEDRLVPSTFTVRNLHDSGPGSLRQAVLDANANPGPDAINFAPGLTGTIGLTSGQLSVTDSVSINGPGAGVLTVSGTHSSRVFDISAGPTVTIAGLTIANGQADQGGGIDNLATLTLSHDVLSGNEALGDSLFTGIAGGVFNEAGARLTVDHCTFVNNHTVGNVGRGWGGGILNEGSASVTASAFIGNQSLGGTEPGQPDNTSGLGFGGAIGNVYGASLTASNSTFTGNQSVAGPGFNGSGGAIGSFLSSLTVSNCTFTANQALGNPSLQGAIGGAIRSAIDVAFNVSNCIFTSNQAIDAIQAIGGAISDEGETASFTNSVFTNNQAIGSSGGAPAFGGAIENTSFNGIISNLTVTSCTITANEALGGAGGDGITTAGFANGGGIDSSSNLTVLNSTITANRAIGGTLAAGAPSNLFTANAGGGISAFGLLTLVNSSVIGNQLVGCAGGAGGPGSIATGGGVEVSSGLAATITNCLIAGNQVVGGAGGSGGPGGAGAGGGIDVIGNSTATITGTTIIGNRALGGAGGSGANGGLGLGGGVSLGTGVLFGSPDSSSLALSGDSLAGNFAVGGLGGNAGNGGDGWGGGLGVLSGTATASNTTISFNSAIGGNGGDDGGHGGNGFGGGIYIATAGSVSVTHGTITYNLAQGGQGDDGGSDGLGIGGGVYDLGVFIFDPTTVIAHNHASTSNDNVFP